MRADVCDLFDEKQLELFRLLAAAERAFGPTVELPQPTFKISMLSFPLVLPKSFFYLVVVS